MRIPFNPVQPGQVVTIKYDTVLPYLRIDNPTNARVYFPDIKFSVGPYTLGAVLPWGINPGIATVDASDLSYANLNIFNNAPISFILTDEESQTTPGLCYAPVANITSTVTISGTITGSVTVTNTINATITNASIPVTQSGTWNINATITNATIAVTQSGTWNINANITNATINVAQSGTWNVGITGNVTIGSILAGSVTFTNSQINVQNVPSTLLATNQPQTSLGTLTLAANAQGNQTFTVPTGTHAIGILVQSGSLTQLKVTGGTTGAPYLSLPPTGVTTANFQGPFMSAFFSAVDTSVTVFGQAGAAGATVKIVAILSAQAEFVFDNISQPTAVTIVGGNGTVLGDVSAPTLSADSLTETISASGLVVIASVQVIASFKAAAGQNIALVGVPGALLKGSSTGVNPLFGQATVAGHALIAIVSGSTNNSNTVAAGWALVVRFTVNGQNVEIWAKLNCGAGEAPPQFTGGSAGAPCMYGQLMEFSGVATVAATDQTGTWTNTGPTTNTVTCSAADAQPGDLVISGSRYAATSVAAVATYTDIFNNNAVAVALGNNGNGDTSSCAAGSVRYVNNVYAIIPPVTTALPLGIQQWPYDARGLSAPSPGVQALVTFAAAPGKRYIATHLSASVVQQAANAIVQVVVLQDGVTNIWETLMFGPAAVGGGSNFTESGLGIANSIGNALSFGYGSGVANISQSVNIGAYLR